MISGYISLLVAMLLTGVWLVLMRLASVGNPGVVIQTTHVAGSLVGVLCVFLPILFLMKVRGDLHAPSGHWYFAAIAGVIICLANVLMLRAFHAGVPVAVVGIVLNLGCIIPLLYGAVFLGERPVPRQWVGIGLALVAIVLLSLPTNATGTDTRGRAATAGAEPAGDGKP